MDIHRPHPLQFSLIVALFSWMVIALTKQTSKQVPHPIQLLLTIRLTPGILLTFDDTFLET